MSLWKYYKENFDEIRLYFFRDLTELAIFIQFKGKIKKQKFGFESLWLSRAVSSMIGRFAHQYTTTHRKWSFSVVRDIVHHPVYFSSIKISHWPIFLRRINDKLFLFNYVSLKILPLSSWRTWIPTLYIRRPQPWLHLGFPIFLRKSEVHPNNPEMK